MPREATDDYKQMIRHADEAMYGAKQSDGNCYQLSTWPNIQV